MIDLFIIDTERGMRFMGTDLFEEYCLLGNVFYVKSNAFVNETKKQHPWFFVIYDNECIEEALVAALRAFMQASFDIVKVYKKELNSKYSISPRMFREYIVLPEFGLLPTTWERLKMEICLNGFLHATC